MFVNSGELDKTPRFAASDLVLHSLPMSHKKDTICVYGLSIQNTNAIQSLYKWD